MDLGTDPTHERVSGSWVLGMGLPKCAFPRVCPGLEHLMGQFITLRGPCFGNSGLCSLQRWDGVVLMQLDVLRRYFSNPQGLGQSFPEGNKMEGAGSVAEEGRGRAGAVPPSPEPAPTKSISACILRRGRAALFIF